LDADYMLQQIVGRLSIYHFYLIVLLSDQSKLLELYNCIAF
jgi:hypothetical protein